MFVGWLPDGIPEESFVNSRVLGWHEADRPIVAPMPGHGDIRREILKESFLIPSSCGFHGGMGNWGPVKIISKKILSESCA